MAINEARTGPINVLVVDDSAIVRQVMRVVLESNPYIRVTTAPDPIVGFIKIERERPNVVITDLEMPRMGGLSFLAKLMDMESPLPVIVCSGWAEKGNERAIAALDLGAVDVITKPQIGVRDFLHESAVLLLDAVFAAAKAKVRRRKLIPVSPSNSADVLLLPVQKIRTCVKADYLIAVGASTGGTEALEQFLMAMPPNCPGIVIVQHMPAGFTRAFAERLNRTCTIRVQEASPGEPVISGQALIAPGDKHLVLRRSGKHYVVDVIDGPLVCRHRPSVDALFRSVAHAAGPRAIGIIMTGMGADGAQGLLEMRMNGASTVAQDEASCVVFGMPREAIQAGAAEHVLPLQAIAGKVLDICRQRSASGELLPAQRAQQ